MRTYSTALHCILYILILFVFAAFSTNAQFSPVISDIPDQEINEGSTFNAINLDDFVEDADHADEVLSWSAENANELIVAIQDQLAIVTISDENWFGNETITFKVIDPDSNISTDEATFSVLAVNDAPVLGDIAGQSILEGASFLPINLDNFVSDIDNNIADLTWTASPNPNVNVGIDASSVATIVPDAGWTGTEIITFIVQDPAGDSDSDDADFTITATEALPEALNDIYEVDEGGTLSIPAPGVLSNDSDADGDAMSAVLISNPLNSSGFNLGADGSLLYEHNGTPTTSDVFTYAASDGKGQSPDATVSITITLLNDNPVITDIPDQSINEGQHFHSIDLDNFVSDEENENNLLAWEATGNTNLNVNINPNTHVASIVPANNTWSGSEIITFTVTDADNGSDSDNAIFSLASIAQAPVANADNFPVIEGGSLNITAPGVLLNDSDGDGDPLTAEIVSNPSLSTAFNLNADGSFTYTHNGNETGNDDSFTYRVLANGEYSNTVTVTIDVTPNNDPPVVADIPNQTVSEGASFTTINLDNFVADPDHADNQITWSFSGNTQLGVTISAARVATITIPSTEWNGMEIITFKATDPESGEDTDAATFTVTSVNNPPVVSDIPNQTVSEGASFTTINLDNFVADPDHADNQITWSFSGNTQLGVTISAARVATITIPSTEWNGSEVITFEATDPGNAKDNDAATFTVTSVNNPPVVSDIPNQTVSEGASFTTINLDNFVADPDHADNQITWSFSGNTQLGVTISAARVATITIPSTEWNGTEVITFEATDPGNAKDNDAATFTVTSVNNPPVVSDIPNQTVSEGASFTTINLDNFVADPDHADNQITWSFSGNTQLGVTISAARVATITIPSTEWNGSEVITFEATDPGNAKDNDAATFTVTSVNNPPVVSDIPNQTVSEGASFTTINLDNFVADPDHADNQITWSFSGNTQLGVTISAARVATITIPSTEWNGTEVITFEATDPGNAKDNDAATFTVTALNDPPVASALAITASNNRIGTLNTAIFTFTDPENDGEGSHIYQWYRSDFPTGLSAVAIPGATGSTYLPVKADGGKYLGFEVTPVDEFGMSGTLVRMASFRYINAAPVATNVRVFAPVAEPGEIIRGRFTYTDKDGDARGNAIYTWYRSSVPNPTASSPGTVVPANDSTYLLKSADAGKYLWFKVKPVATVGSTPGDSVWSNVLGPIGEYSANITGTETVCAGAEMKIILTVTAGLAPYEARLHRAGTLAKDTVITNIEQSPRDIFVKIPGTYTLISLTDANDDVADVSGSTPVIKSISPKSRAVISGSTSICTGIDSYAPLTLTFTGGTAPWNVTIRRRETPPYNDTIISNINTSIYNFSARIIGSGPTRHRVIAITDQNGCAGDTTSGSAWLSYKFSPIATITGSDSICPGESARITVTLIEGLPDWSFTYVRNGANPITIDNISTPSRSFNVTQPGRYSIVEVIDAQQEGCGSGEAVIAYNSIPTAAISGSATICEHTTANLSVALTGSAPWKFYYTRNLGDSVVVENVTTSPRAVPASLAGNYTLYKVSDRNKCAGTVSGTGTVAVTPAPEVTISGLKQVYNRNTDGIDTIVGTPAGGIYAGPSGVFGNLFIPVAAPLGTHNITYAYRVSPASCYGYDTVIINVLEADGIITIGNNRTKFCTNDAPFVVTGINRFDVEGFFTITGGVGIQPYGRNTALVSPKALLSKRYTIIYTYVNNDGIFTEEIEIEIGNPPEANFTWATECFQAEQPIDFTDKSSSSFGYFTDTSYYWKIYTSTGYDEDSLQNITYTFGEEGRYTIELQVQNSNGCRDTAMAVFNLRPTFKLNEVYFEDFEDNPLSWDSGKEKNSVNSWRLETPVRHGSPLHGFPYAHSGEKSWFTYINSYPAPTEKSWITSPCFDFTGIERPMLTMWMWRLFNSNRDGANMKASADSGKTWTLVGEIGDGINWYNSYGILGQPDGTPVGWSNDNGTSNDNSWVRARHSLDFLKGEKEVQFRIFYGSAVSAQNNDGIAIDDFMISARDKMALIEHFTNSNLDKAEKADSILDAMVEIYGNNVVDLQYHTSNPAGDPFYNHNQSVPKARQYYYGMSVVPLAILDGSTDSKHLFDYASKPLDKNAIIVESLEDNLFDIRLEASINNNNLNTEAQIWAKDDVSPTEMSVRIAVVERIIDEVVGNNGDTIFRNVVKTMLPGPGGKTFDEGWTKGQDRRFEGSWEVENVYDVNKLRVVAFIQNEQTREVYQVAYTDSINFSVGYVPPFPAGDKKLNYYVYPNPVKHFATVQFGETLVEDIVIQLFNNTGKLVYSGVIQRGNSSEQIPVENLPDGLYLLRLANDHKLLGVSKLMISK